MSRPFAVFGGINADVIAETDGPPIAGASNPGAALRRIGGVGFHVANVLARLGNPVRLVGRVGPDEEGRRAIAAARAVGIVTEGIGESARFPTGSYTAVFDDEGELHIGVADMRLYDELVPNADTHIADPPERTEIMALDANLPRETIAWLTEHAVTGSHDVAALTVSPTKALRMAPSLPAITWLFANRAEAVMLIENAGAAAPEGTADLAAMLSGLGPTGVVVSDGPRPLAVAERENVVMVAPPRVPVVRVNGAGDTLAAGTLHRLAAGDDLMRAVGAGLAAAALVLEHGGIAEAGIEAAKVDHLAELLRQREEA